MSGGYARKYTLDLEKRRGTVDQLFHNIWPPSAVNPKNPQDYREVNAECTKHVKMLSEKIMEWLSEGLGLRREAINEVVGGEYLLNVNYYPPCPHPDVIRGLNPHTDVSGLTLLITNEIPGFQVFKDDQLIEVEYIPFTVIVNISDQILRLSSGRYKSVLHQTTVDKERIRMLGLPKIRSWDLFPSLSAKTILPNLGPCYTRTTFTARFDTCRSLIWTHD
ncbi:hypothetical protein Bca4012_033626 [Brassica carinata]